MNLSVFIYLSLLSSITCVSSQYHKETGHRGERRGEAEYENDLREMENRCKGME
jgi:hypothetical protein